MSEYKKGKKRPKSYYIKCAGGKKFKHSNDLAAGMKGFLVTCNKYEKETVREMYNILNEYADQKYGPEMKEVEEDASGSEEEDMEKAMAKEAKAMKETASKERRFQNTDTKTKNCIFIRTTVESPCELAHEIFTDIVTKQVQRARYALRMLPISVTCKTNMDNIRDAGENILKPHFETEFGVGLKYTSVCKIRNNQSVSRTTILPALGKIIHELNPLHRLCHDDPDLVIIVEVIRNICCLSVVKDYFQFKKYNFHEALKNSDTCDKVSVKKEGNVQDMNLKEINSSEEIKEEPVSQQEVPKSEITESVDRTAVDEIETINETCESEGDKTTNTENSKGVNSANNNKGIETGGDSDNKEIQVEVTQGVNEEMKEKTDEVVD